MGALALALTVTTGLEAQTATGLTPYQLAHIQSVGQAAVSPDGSQLAVTRYVPRDPFDANETPWTELHVVDLATGESRGFITGQNQLHAVAWTPDGNGISFLARRADDEATSLYVIPALGGEARRVLTHETSILAYDWSPAGEVVYIAREARQDPAPGLPYQVEVYEELGQDREVFVATPEDEATPRRLRVEGSVYQALWSPTGDRVAVAVAPSPWVDDFYMLQRVKVVDVRTGRVIAEIQNEGKLGEIAWSPSGDRLALISGENINDPAAGRLLVADASGGAPQDILPGFEGHVEDIDWVERDAIRYLASVGVGSRYASVSPRGDGDRVLYESDEMAIGEIAVSADGRTTGFVASTPEHPSEAYVMQRNQPQRLTYSNPWLEDVRLADHEIVTYEARDGLEIQGILIRPLDYEPGQRYPLILSVHGGPEAHDDNGWLTSYADLGQLAAARGYAVFFPNYRGSTGRGVEFSVLSQADPAGKEFDDLVDAVDHFVEIGLADPERVGVTGGSYGGYATGWLATRYTDHFAAGVMFVGISNKVSKVGTTDIPNEEFLVHAMKRPWDDWQFFLERSPIYYADDTETPLLIMHGAEDPRVDAGQSHELFRHLKLRSDAPVRLVLYPGEGHGNRRATARYDYSLRSLRWFDHYLKGPGGEPPTSVLEVDRTARLKLGEELNFRFALLVSRHLARLAVLLGHAHLHEALPAIGRDGHGGVITEMRQLNVLVQTKLQELLLTLVLVRRSVDGDGRHDRSRVSNSLEQEGNARRPRFRYVPDGVMMMPLAMICNSVAGWSSAAASSPASPAARPPASSSSAMAPSGRPSTPGSRPTPRSPVSPRPRASPTCRPSPRHTAPPTSAPLRHRWLPKLWYRIEETSLPASRSSTTE